MRYVEFAKDLAEHFGEVVIIVYMFEERLVILFELLHVHAVHVSFVEHFFFLLYDMVEHVFPFGFPVKVHPHAESERSRRTSRHGYFLRRAAEYVEVVSALVENKGGI